MRRIAIAGLLGGLMLAGGFSSAEAQAIGGAPAFAPPGGAGIHIAASRSFTIADTLGEDSTPHRVFPDLAVLLTGSPHDLTRPARMDVDDGPEPPLRVVTHDRFARPILLSVRLLRAGSGVAPNPTASIQTFRLEAY